jgi:ubiquinone/menaquinone biosynthesis C-methylase UbiE
MTQRPAGDVQIWDKWNMTYRLGELDRPIQVRLRAILSTMETLKIPQARILEVGCGTGWLSAALRRFGKVSACDIGEKIIELAKTKYPEVDFYSGDIHDIDLLINHFDVIVTEQVLAHVADQTAFMHRLAELLKKGGYLVLTTQNKFVFDRTAGIDPPDGWIRKWVTMKELKGLLKDDFVLEHATTLEPEGHLGVLRVVNSVRVNNYANAALGQQRVTRLKEWAGFGQALYVVARKR